MQTAYKIWKLKGVYEKVLKKLLVTYKSIKKVLQVLESVQKSPPVENLRRAETSQSTHNANKLTGCNKTWPQNQRRLRTDQNTINTCNFII